MDSFHRELIAQKERLQRAIYTANKVLADSPSGSLRISDDKDCTRYYHVTQKGDTLGKYISVKNKSLAGLLAQKDYARKLIIEATHELKKIDEWLEFKSKHSAETVYASIRIPRQKLFDPILRNEEERIRYWNSLPYNVSTDRPEERIFLTKRGEMVRSKSELMIADMYYDLGIPYRYECELVLKRGIVRHPDFTLYHSGLRTVYYHEHLGRLDDEEYRLRNMRKLRLYEDNGYFIGKNLLVSWESEKFPFNIQSFREEIKQIFWIE